MEFNPNGFEDQSDLCHTDPGDEPGWSESYAIWAYFDDHYLYMHFQRHPTDKSIWRGYAVVCAEDGTVYAAHNFGRQISDAGPGYQQCHGYSEKPFERFTVKIDAIAQISDTQSLRKQAIQSLDAATTPLVAELTLNSVSRTYAPMSSSKPGSHSNAKWTHYTPCNVSGVISIGEKRYELNKVPGWRDHSTGPRSFSSMGRGFMMIGSFPSGKSFMAIGVGTHREDGGFNEMSVGGITIDGALEPTTSISFPEAIFSNPQRHTELGEIRLESGHGTATISIKTTGQGVPFALLPPNFEAIGLPEGDDQDLRYFEWRTEIEWDGEIGVGSWEPCFSGPNRQV